MAMKKANMAGSTVMRARAVLSDPRRVRPAISLGHSCRIVLMMFCNLTIYPSIDFFPSCFFGQGEESALHPSIKYGFLHHRFLYVEVFFTAYSCQCYLWESTVSQKKSRGLPSKFSKHCARFARLFFFMAFIAFQ